MASRHWDRGLDYEYVYSRLSRMLKRSLKSKRTPAKPCHSAIALIQLRNGLRAGESVRAFQEFIKTGKRELTVRVEKKKREEKRLVIIPDEVVGEIREKCIEYADKDPVKLTVSYKSYVLKVFGFNTHSLRYAFITYLLRNGVNPSIIAKITHHSKLDFILEYTQEREAERVLKNLF